MAETTVADELTEQIHLFGENMKVLRFVARSTENGAFGSYIHNGGKIGVIVEFSFTVPPAFAGKFIDTTPGMIAKQTEEARGDPVVGAVAKVSDSLFWLALSGLDQDVSRNIQLLKERSWIDIPIRYGNRRRAILTFEKGAPGDKVFADAFAAWGE